MRFGLVDLRLFLHVAETGSITAGAERANMALASASARIRGMEEALGAALLERKRRGVALTPAGRALLRHARIVLEQIGQMQSELAKYASGFKGCVRILANTAAASEFLPEALSAFLVAHPDTDIELEERPSYDIVRVVAEGGADVGVLASIADPGGLETFPFATDRLVAVMPRAHSLAARRRLAFRELLDHELVGLGGASALQRHLAEHAAQAGVALKLRVRVNGFDAICRMVENGVGLAVIPETAALRCRRSMAIRVARLTDAWALRRLSICVRRLDGLPAHARQLVRHLEAWAGRESPVADLTAAQRKG